MSANFGLVERPRSTDGRGITPPFLCAAPCMEINCYRSTRGARRAGQINLPYSIYVKRIYINGGFMPKEKILSCFIDESGDFGKVDNHNPFYYVALVFHDQDIDITNNIKALDNQIINWDYPLHAIHTGPLVRREDFYINDNRENRRALFNALYHFTRKLDIKYICPKINKQDLDTSEKIELVNKISKAIIAELKSQNEYIQKFDELIVYYDNGQIELTKIITSVFNAMFSNVEYRKVKPIDYKLLQVADLVCTMELIEDKAERNAFSKSEREFFGTPKEFKKNLYRQFVKKRM